MRWERRQLEHTEEFSRRETAVSDAAAVHCRSDLETRGRQGPVVVEGAC